MAVSTLYDVYCKYKNQGSPHPLLIAFSTYTNGQSLFETSSSAVELSCLNGIRFLSMMWVIAFHQMWIALTASTNILDIFEWLDSTRSMIITNGVFAVDTFLVITGFLVVYSYMKSMHQGSKFNIITFYLHRYIRLTPPFAAVIVTSMTLMRHMGSGPGWQQLEQDMRETCQKHWWSALIYVQNYVNVEEMCITQTWYLNIDWQLYLISPVFLLTFNRFPKIGVISMFLATMGSMAAGYIITTKNELASMQTELLRDRSEFMSLYYYVTHTRAAPWFIGGLLGYYISRIKFTHMSSSVEISKWIILPIWALVLTVIPVCVFMGQGLRHGEYQVVPHALYNTFVKPVWALCISWIILACAIGYGGIINGILSLPIFKVLNRFTYSIYLLHLTIINMISSAQKVKNYFSMFNIAFSFWGIFMLCFGLSIFWVLAFESPFINLEKYVLRKLGTGARHKRQERNNNAKSATTQEGP